MFTGSLLASRPVYTGLAQQRWIESFMGCVTMAEQRVQSKVFDAVIVTYSSTGLKSSEDEVTVATKSSSLSGKPMDKSKFSSCRENGSCLTWCEA